MGTSVIWAIFWIMNVRDKRNESVKLFLNFFFASIYLIVFSLVTGQGMPEEWSEYGLDMYIGLFEMGLAYLFWLKALQFSETTDKISNLVFIFPFISLIFIHFILGEKIYFTTIYGLILVVTGIMLQRLKLKRTP
jgi:drug/metabolite transporter (DMT)-like permease